MLDIQMPEMDGYEALKAMREKGIRAPIVALTAHALTEEKERARQAGFDGYLTKPIAKATLINEVESRLITQSGPYH